MTSPRHYPPQMCQPMTLAELQNDRLELQEAMDELLKHFGKKYWPATVQISCRQVTGELQSTVTVTLP